MLVSNRQPLVKKGKVVGEQSWAGETPSTFSPPDNNDDEQPNARSLMVKLQDHPPDETDEEGGSSERGLCSGDDSPWIKGEEIRGESQNSTIVVASKSRKRKRQSVELEAAEMESESAGSAVDDESSSQVACGPSNGSSSYYEGKKQGVKEVTGEGCLTYNVMPTFRNDPFLPRNEDHIHHNPLASPNSGLSTPQENSRMALAGMISGGGPMQHAANRMRGPVQMIHTPTDNVPPHPYCISGGMSQHLAKKPFMPYGLPAHSQGLPEIYSHGLRSALVESGNGPGGRLNHMAGEMPTTESSTNQDVLPLYVNAAAAPSRLPAHKPVRLNQPKHPLAPPGTPVYFKYGEEHYPEETIPETYTFTESDGTVCRYITNFLVYNKRGERLLPIEVLDQPRHGALVLYGSLLSAASVGGSLDNGSSDGTSKLSGRASGSRSNGRTDRRRNAGSKGRKGEEDGPCHAPYPVRVELSEWCIDYGQEPQNIPFIWLISRWDVYYRLEKPAGRYIPTFATAKMKFEVSTRVIKTLQFRPEFPYRELVDYLTAAARQDRMKRRLEEQRQRRKENRRHKKQEGGGISSDSNVGRQRYSPTQRGGGLHNESDDAGIDTSNPVGDDSTGFGGVGISRKKSSRPNWKVHYSLSSPEGTGVCIELSNGQQQPRTPWGAAFAVEGVRESTLLGLTDFLDSQMRNFLDGVGGAGGDCANLLDTRFMQTLREKSSFRRETLQLVEAKKRALESMAAASGFPHLTAPATFEIATPIVALQVIQPLPIRHSLAPGTQVATGGLLGSPMVSLGFAEQGVMKTAYDTNPHHHQALLMLKSRHQEEQELGQLLQLLKEFSDPERLDAPSYQQEGNLKEEYDEHDLDDSAPEDGVLKGEDGGASSAASEVTVRAASSSGNAVGKSPRRGVTSRTRRKRMRLCSNATKDNGD